MNLHRLRTIIGIELRQRVRSVGWYVLLGIFAVILIALLSLSFAAFSLTTGGSEWFFSLVIMLVLLLTLLVSPTLSGSAVNGDRDAATLAPVQVTLVTTTEIVIGKFLAAWISGLAFLVVALPFLVVATLAGELNPGAIVTSLGILIIEVGVVAAIGVGLSAVIARPIFSVASTYLLVAALTVGTLIAFGLGGAALRTQTTTISREVDWNAIPAGCDPGAPVRSTDCPSYDQLPCVESRTLSEQPRFDRVWWILAANPFVILADATPPTYVDGYPTDLFSQIASGVRLAQITPDVTTSFDGCAQSRGWSVDAYPSTEQRVAGTAPSWFVGLFVQLLLAGGLLAWGVARTRTPAKRLPPGTRIA
ncbi:MULTISPECIES: ABC transporter permease [Microbacterium]|uniref:ABC transporter permease n=1 Tax=Microbacterium TaxID=33882 RepID=UPI000CCDB25F|nr:MULTISPECIES: ABC transporter permease [Microbacterium]MDZ5145874.1 ABC transporter permease [Microbacterium testaceum]PNW10177.1 ABC transporter permease [Microbacterium testaceum]REC99749.1 ABC-type transport system involved in multi-copper enzyme maturation permease subunit [Microbacterium sp. AG157]WJS91533.1 ABC transporter permease [Microbacterium testaceum]